MNDPFNTDGAEGVAEFHQPSLEDADPTHIPMTPVAELTERVPVPARASIAERGDELSVAARQQMAPMHVAPPEVKQPPGRFKLSYEYNGQSIIERHRSVPHALASIRRLKMMGIVPATSTDPAPARTAA